jgi:Pyruvate/2-oxoacid:ferredoxin oxidoreductase delta subunit
MRTPFSVRDIQNNENEAEHLKCMSVEHYERCVFCNSKLIFTHDLNLSYLQVIETSRCPGCGVAPQPKKFTLQ